MTYHHKVHYEWFIGITLSVEVNPFAAHAYFNRGNLLKRNGNIMAAEEDYRKGSNI